MLNSNKTISGDIRPLIYSPRAKPLGLTYEILCLMWCKWFLSVPKLIHPANDFSGTNGLFNQVDSKLIFLCQTIENTTVVPKRHLKISKMSQVFMPIINWISILHTDGETDSQLRDVARKRMDQIGDLELVINNTRLTFQLKDYRFTSPCANVILPESNILGIPGGLTRIITDGFWIFTQPLPENTCIKTFGTCSAGTTRIEVEYFIEMY